MNLRLDGKKALVTVSTAGIGVAIARALAREGASVVIMGHTQGRLEKYETRVIGYLRYKIGSECLYGLSGTLTAPYGMFA